MAAGDGTRLRPITELWPKPILPIDGRPVIATLLRQLGEEGLGPVTVVTGYLAEQVEELLDGLDVRFARQPEPNGSADAVVRALDGGATLPALVSAADSVFRRRRPGQVRRGLSPLRARPARSRTPVGAARSRFASRKGTCAAWSTRSPASSRRRRSGA